MAFIGVQGTASLIGSPGVSSVFKPNIQFPQSFSRFFGIITTSMTVISIIDIFMFHALFFVLFYFILFFTDDWGESLVKSLNFSHFSFSFIFSLWFTWKVKSTN